MQEAQGFYRKEVGNQERDSRNESRQSVSGDQPTVQSTIGCLGTRKKEYLRLKLNISKEDELLFLIDTGAELSLVRGKKFTGSIWYNPSKRVKVKSVKGSETETFGTVTGEVQVRYNSVPLNFS
jgi:hypothetical protein